MRKLVDKTVQEFLLSLLDEETEFWVIIKDLTTSNHTLTRDEIEMLSKAVVSELIEKYGVEEIDPLTRKIHKISVPQASKKIDNIFTHAPHRLPTIGDGFWLIKVENTENILDRV